MLQLDSRQQHVATAGSASKGRVQSRRTNTELDAVADFDLEWLLSPTPPSIWLGEYHERKPLLIARNDPAYFASFFTLDDFDRLLACGSWSWPHVRLVMNGQYVHEATQTQAGTGFSNDKLLAEFQRGASIVLEPQQFCPPMAALARTLEAHLSYRIGGNVWLTPKGAAPTAFHYDVENVLVLQISGCKLWRIYEPSVLVPTESQVWRNINNLVPGKLLFESTLCAGDVLYVPRGFGHEVIPLEDQHSLHMSFAWQVPTVYHVIRNALDELMHRDPTLRHALPPGFGNADRAHFALELVESIAAAVLPDLDFDVAVSELRRKFLDDVPPMLRGAFAQSCCGSAVTLVSSVRCRPYVLSRLERQEESVHLSFHGKTLRMPLCAEPALKFVLESAEFLPRSIPGEMDDHEKVHFVQTLVSEGLLMLSSPAPTAGETGRVTCRR